ncbi:response regulator [Noviherbaspirillum aerium]|uniref:response regulator n=1 Tax=Noviherbaspirillum aerium TaxID=2588497 RepID=UPI00178C3396|nr:response regulator [Noviherbaspirillum aerium]
MATHDAPGVQAHRLLLVDDDPDLLEITFELLSAYGFDVTAASSAEAALAILQDRNDFEILLSDVVMPGMSGLQLAYKARELHPQLKIILVSGYPNPAIESGHGYLGDFEFLEKPYRVDDILRLADEG